MIGISNTAESTESDDGGQIIKDENVRNAVSSTQQYKKAVKEREEYLKEGKTSPSNTFFFLRKCF